jgi:hypothetical protein
MTATYTQIRDAIEQIAGDDIGFYTISGNQAKAIMIIPPEPQTTWQVKGLEIIISRDPQSTDEGMHGGIKRINRWEVILNQWDRSEFNALKKVRDNIVKAFKVREKPIYQKQTDSAYERCTIFIRLQNYIRDV